jgi:hypothetical protein
MYLVCKFSGTWSLFNANNGTSRPLQPQQIDLIKELFSDDLRENAILDALQVIPISANKLQQLSTGTPPPGISKKSPESGVGTNQGNAKG